MRERRTIDDLLLEARSRIRRYTPAEAAAAVAAGAVVIDTRSDIDVQTEGRIPGSVYFHRNVLEWRCDPAASHSDQRVNDVRQRLIIVCNDGCSSSLAAASLVALGFAEAGDLIGGYRSWVAAGLPVDRECVEPNVAVCHNRQQTVSWRERFSKFAQAIQIQKS
ncbi:rhodanese-like domain-containing protein [Mesorhizobium sp. M1143]|uniref:rhodanese-like domain-containing protein n=1 Tax=Mesorhizobium sp. M1143 TaxID=2957061 RepID=UPI00333BB1DC